jgi:hypothetical protein
MTAALFGLLGVVVGGVLNGTVAWRLESARSMRTARGAARLVRDELRGIEREFSFAAGIRARGKDILALPTTDWEKYRAALAESLTAEQFDAVSVCFVDLGYWKSVGEAWEGIDDDPKQALRDSAENANVALRALVPLAADSPPWHRRLLGRS